MINCITLRVLRVSVLNFIGVKANYYYLKVNLQTPPVLRSTVIVPSV
jgi:hypothetical protein